MPEGYIDIDAAIKLAKSIITEKYEVLERLDIVRTDLRNAVRLNQGTPEQREWIEGTFPIRKRKREGKAQGKAQTTQTAGAKS